MSDITPQQQNRKDQSEKIILEKKIKINSSLPYLEAEDETTIRTAEEVARRLVVLAAVNLVAFDNFSEEEITTYLKEFHLWEHTTPNEKEFLANPTEEAKSQESWKVECIWVLLWALNIIEDLGFPSETADLNNVPADDYPFGGLDIDPNGFITHYSDIRSKQEIMDAADLYYRIDWACVDARINEQPMNEAHPGVVYERHYALNWLTNYMDQDWDDISCDT